MNKKLVVEGAIVLLVVIITVFLVVMLLNAPSSPPSPLFTVTGKQQNTFSVSGNYEVVSWDFTFAYNGKSALQNVNLYLNNGYGDDRFQTVPEVTKGWTYNYIWAPSDISANVTITVSWQGGTESYVLQP